MQSRKLFTRLLIVSLALAAVFVPGIKSFAASAYQVVVHVPSAVMPADASVTLKDSVNQASSSISRLVGNDSYGWFAVVDVPAGAASVKVSATGLTASSSSVNPSSTREIWLSTKGVPSTSEVRATGVLKVWLVTSGSGLSNRKLKVTAGKSVTYPKFVRTGSKLYVNVPVAKTVSSLTIAPMKGSVVGKAVSIAVTKNAQVWLGDSFTGARYSEAWANNTVKIHYHRPDGIYSGWGLHVWSTVSGGGASGTTGWESPLSPVSITPDAWGVTFVVKLKANSKSLPYIIHKGDLKDPAGDGVTPATGDQLLSLAATRGEVWFESGRINANYSARYTIPVPLSDAPNFTAAGLAPTAEEASALASDSVRSVFANDSIYFVMTDRYANGNTANDHGYLTGGSQVDGFNPAGTGYYHGGDLAGLTGGCTTGDGIARIKDMGFTSIWLTPPFKQRYVQGGSAAYHGYWITDFTDIDPHLGTKAEFKDFIDCAHSQGIKVVMDIVMNHTGDVIDYIEGDYNFGSVKTTYVAPSDKNIKAPAFLNGVTNYHNRGNVGDWGNKEQYQNGDFFGLDDVYTEKPAVVEGFAQVYASWVNDYGVDGFRIDTAKHVDDAFFGKWWPRVKELTAASNPNLFAYGEVYDSNPSVLTQFVRDRALPSVLDFAFQRSAVQFAAGNNISDITNMWAADDWYTTSGSNAYNQVTFMGNHDMGRFGQMLKWAGDPAGDLWGDALLGYDLMYLSRGIPNVYYGDENGIIGTGGDQASRQDMFPTAVNAWKSEARIAANPIGSGSYLAERNHAIQVRIKALSQLRTDYPAIASGAQIVRYSSNNVVAFSRIDQPGRREFLVALNNSQSSKSVTIQTSSPNTWFTNVWGMNQSVQSNGSGQVTITVPDRQAVVLRADDTLPAAPTVGSVTLTLPKDNGVNLWKPAATISGWTDPSVCTFVVKVNDGSWQVLGVDDAFDWKMILDGAKYPNGAAITVAAIVKSSSGAIGVSNAITVTNNR